MNVINMPSVAQNTKPSASGSFQFDDDRYCLIPDGEYLAGFEFYRTDHMFKGAAKLELWFTILDDDFQGRSIPKWYNCQKCQKNRKYGNFKVARRSNFSIEFVRLFNHEIKRSDRAPMSYFEKHYFIIETETVTKNFQQTNYPEQLQYSKVKRIKKALPL